MERLALVVVALLLAVAAPARAYQRPTESGPPPVQSYEGQVYGQPPYAVAEAPPACTARVCVHYVTTTADAPLSLTDANADSVPDSVALLRDQTDTAIARETGQVGWPQPVSDGSRGGDARVDLYVRDLRGRAYGVTGFDNGESFNGPLSGFVLVDRSYTPAPSAGSAANALLISAHELNHLEQFALDSYFESWFAEATAQWTVQEVEPALGTVRRGAGGWAHQTGLPLLARRPPDNSQPPTAYTSAVFDAWLAGRHGADAPVRVWQEAAKVAVGQSFVPASIEGAFAASGASFFDEYVHFAAAHPEWATPSSGFPDASGYPDVDRSGTLGTDGSTLSTVLDQTSFRLYDVPVRPGTSLTVRAAAPPGLQAAVALVGRRGAAPDATVDTALKELPGGGQGEVTLADPGRYSRITAVLVNADASRASENRDAGGRWVFTRDAQPFTATAAISVPPPAPPTPSPVSEPAPAAPAAAMPGPPPVISDQLRPLTLTLLGVTRRGRSVRVRLRSSAPATLRAELRTGGHLAGRLVARRRAGTTVLSLRLTVAGRRALRRPHPSLRLVLSGRSAGGGQARLARRIALRRSG